MWGGNKPQPMGYQLNQDSGNSDLPIQVGLKPVTPVQARKGGLLHAPLSCGLPASLYPRSGTFPGGTALADTGQLDASLLMSDASVALTRGQRHQ